MRRWPTSSRAGCDVGPGWVSTTPPRAKLADRIHRHRHSRSVQYSVGFDVDADVRTAIGRLPSGRCMAGLDNTTGNLRGDIAVAKITDLLADRLRRTGWPQSMRVIVRRTKLAPGEQPTLFHLDG